VSNRRLFLSYRREDSGGHAGRLADHLLDRFGNGSVFTDVESIEAGADFTEEIDAAILGCDAVLVVIGPTWVDTPASSGARRLDEPSDFVRREIQTALASDARVIPVLVGGARMPAESDLPPPIAPLAHRHAVELLDRRWRVDVDGLIDAIEGRAPATFGDLPVQPTPFLGREREVSAIVEALRGGNVRIVTLTGPGGIGKTRLAVQVSTEVAGSYPGGAWFVGLAGLSDPALLLPEVAQTIEVQDPGEGRLVDVLTERLLRARSLLVLDNVEQLLPAIAETVAALSAAAGTLDLIVTSREAMRVSAEREFPVDVLTADDAVALFVERAPLDRRSELAAADPEILVEICTRLDRLPLAIELAAARTRMMPPAMLLERLGQRLPLLTGGPRDVPQRQQTLRGAISWSYDLLTGSERALFERLGVFVDGWTLEAAESVCQADLDTLGSLIEKSLVHRSSDAEARFRMLETIREFAVERLTKRGDDDEVRARHAHYYAAIAEEAAEALKGPDQARWLTRLDRDRENFRAALQWSLDHEPELSLTSAVGLACLWFLRGPVSEGRLWLAEALARSSATPTATRSSALEWAALLATEQGDENAALALLEEAIVCAREVGALAAEALATTRLAGVLLTEDPSRAMTLAEEAVRLARASDDRWVLAIALNQIGETHRSTGDHHPAVAAYEESLALRRALGDETLVALALVNLAEMSLLMRDPARAMELAEEAIELCVQLGDRRDEALARSAVGWASLAEGTVDRAWSEFDRAMEMTDRLGYAHDSVTLLFGMAGTAAAAGEVDRAARLDGAARRWQAELGSIPSAADSDIHRGYLDDLRSRADATAWESSEERGAGMSLSDAVAFARARDR
jgi:predicted ATPase